MKPSKVEEPVKVFRILLVDDNHNGLLARKSVLEEHGYVVHASSNPEEALAEFSEQPYDLVVTDYRMPKMTGAQLIKQIRLTHPGIPVVLVSGVVDVLGLDERSTGANVVIPKNSTEVPNLLRAVKRLFEAQTLKKPVRSQAGNSAAKKKSAGKR
jgi:CheY-like chemotaxis protein